MGAHGRRVGDEVDLRLGLDVAVLVEVVELPPVPICSRLIQPKPRLSVSTTVNGTRRITAVASSEFAIM